ncbi:MAG: hypothetical protein A2583_06585 [Bdellovibrionales bacterium RIFOXYD1_FULL_53_11]|nr:MAG: hypothetical protein A2583_06585 [Bdellovibrionales bacterium RIFOXYD1_FULL_53_11]
MARLSEKFHACLHELSGRYPARRALLLPALHMAQKEIGWLPPDVIGEIAAALEIHPAKVVETASFYTMFNLGPVGRHDVRVCTNVSCSLRGAERILEHCERKLGISAGETTADGRITLHDEECLGACGTAPAMSVDGKYHENLDLLEVDRILEGLH